jgi:hypothetical protein
MATGLTPNYSLHYPIPTDPVDVAGDIELLADDVDTALLNKASLLSGVPVGGTAGQILSKVNSTDYNTQWVQGEVRTLQAPAYVTGRYYSTPYFSTSSSTIGINTTKYLQFYVSETTTFDRISIVTSSIFTGTSVIRLGIYANSSGTLPSTVLLDAGTVSANEASTIFEATISQSLSKGWYWLAANTISTTGTNNFSALSGSGVLLNHLFGTTGLNNTQVFVQQNSTNATSGFATATGTSYTATAGFLIALRKS